MAATLRKIGPQQDMTAKLESAQSKRNLAVKIQIFVVLNIVLLLGLGIFSYLKYSEYTKISDALATNTALINQKKTELNGVYNELRKEQNDYQVEKFQADKALDVVFPKAEAYTELIRQLDRFFFNLNQTNPPILHNNLRFEGATLSDDGRYYVLPFSMAIETSKDNFTRFLEYVENSGGAGSETRLMSIQSIQINFIKPAKNTVNEFDLSFTVNMEAYFQNNNLEPDNG